jgi:hypothetical protein
LVTAAVLSALAFSSAATAQTASLELKPGAWVRTSDGAPIGRIEYVDKAKDGSPTGVAVIYDMRVVHIPADSLSAGQKGIVTSLAKADVSKLR